MMIKVIKIYHCEIMQPYLFQWAVVGQKGDHLVNWIYSTIIE